MVTTAEVMNAVLKGIGLKPTRFLFRWEPTLKNPFKLGLLEVFRCDTDGGVGTPTMPQHHRAVHGGHRFKDPHHYSLWELLKVQLRLIR